MERKLYPRKRDIRDIGSGQFAERKIFLLLYEGTRYFTSLSKHFHSADTVVVAQVERKVRRNRREPRAITPLLFALRITALVLCNYNYYDN